MEETNNQQTNNGDLIKPLDFETEEFQDSPQILRHDLSGEDNNKVFYKKIGIFALVAILGIFSGWGVYSLVGGSSSSEGKESVERPTDSEEVNKGDVFGSDSDLFKDEAVGVIQAREEEGVGDGTHMLLREGGESQTAYLTSSVLDLDMFIGRKVQVWGQTFDSTNVSWLMDIGKIKVIE